MDRTTLSNLCGLARLRLDAAETEAFAEKFEGLLAFVERILDYEPQSAEPTLSSGSQLELRKDHPHDSPWPPGTAHAYRVPTIINFEGEG